MGHINQGRRYIDPNDEPLVVMPYPCTEEWHARARELRNDGWFIRDIAREVNRGFSPVQRFLNPESKARQADRKNELEKLRRRTEPEYAEASRSYRRRYAQLNAPKRWKK